VECSLFYLARESSERGRPSHVAARFDHLTYGRRRKASGLSAEQIRHALDLSPRDRRRLALGTYEPTLEQARVLEGLLTLPPGSLLAAVDQ
jgi:ribosome-binding protein aMBF1 (putative translation factor)